MTSTRKKNYITELLPFMCITSDNAFLVHREIFRLVKEYRNKYLDGEVIYIDGAKTSEMEISTALSPSLFAHSSLCVIENAESLTEISLQAILGLITPLPEDYYLIMALTGQGVGIKKIITKMRLAQPCVTELPGVSSISDRVAFVKTEFEHCHISISKDLALYVLDCVGNDLANLVAAVSQLSADCQATGKTLNRSLISQYFQGRPEITGFDIADKTMGADIGGALEDLRWAIYHHVPLVLIADALAESVNTLARLKAQNSLKEKDKTLIKLPVWKTRKFEQYLKNWHPKNIDEALVIVANLNREVKGFHQYPEFAIENAIKKLGALARKK